jgi:hypothetical protein
MSKKRSNLDVAETVKKACIDAAREGFRDASISGLCTDGAIEAAISAIQKLDMVMIVKKQSGT